MVIYRIDYEQKRINEQITVPKHTWKVKANATLMVQQNNNISGCKIFFLLLYFIRSIS